MRPGLEGECASAPAALGVAARQDSIAQGRLQTGQVLVPVDGQRTVLDLPAGGDETLCAVKKRPSHD